MPLEKKLSLGPSRCNVLMALVPDTPLWQWINHLRYCLKNELKIVHQLCSRFQNLCSSRAFGVNFTQTEVILAKGNQSPVTGTWNFLVQQQFL